MAASDTELSVDLRPALGRRLGARADPRLTAVLALHCLLPLLIAAAWARTIQHVSLISMSDLGLISVLPWTTTALLFALTISFAFSLRQQPLRPLVPLIHVLVLVVLLYGITAFLEHDPRFASAYRHVGVISYIAQNHSVDPNIDAYFNWPGFFVLGAVLTKAAGLSSAVSLLPWAPLAFNLLFLAPLLVIFRWASPDPRVHWAALWAFYSANWVGQDYLSPQVIGYLLWLSMLGALLVSFARRPQPLPASGLLRATVRAARPRRIIDRLSRPVELPATSGQRTGLILLVLIIYAAAVTGHQLTPFAALFTVAVLALFAGLATHRLPIVMAVLLAAWLSYMTTKYLAGHLDEILRRVGTVDQNVNQNVSGRLAGSHDHQLIVDGRLIASAAIWMLAALGFARRLHARRWDIAMAVIGVTPFLLLGLQAYGGEILLRVFLFGLPAVAFFIASLAFPSPGAGRGRVVAIAVPLVGCALLWAFQYTRYGNERLDYFTPGDTAAVHALYRAAPQGSVLYAGSLNLPWRYQDYASYSYNSIGDLPEWGRSAKPSSRLLARQLQAKLPPRGGYVIITRSTEVDAKLLQGRPGALNKLVRLLRSSPQVKQIYRGSNGYVFYVPSQPQLR